MAYPSKSNTLPPAESRQKCDAAALLHGLQTARTVSSEHIGFFSLVLVFFSFILFGTAGIACGAASMKRLSVRRLLSHHSIAATACGGFAAESRAGRIYRSTAAAARRPAAAALQHVAAARRSAANAGNVTLTADVRSRTQTCFIFPFIFLVPCQRVVDYSGFCQCRITQ